MSTEEAPGKLQAMERPSSEPSLPTLRPSGRPDSTLDEGDCPECNGLGYLRHDVPWGHEKFGKVDPCPHCSRGLTTARLKRYSRLRGELADANLARWKPLPGVEHVLADIIGYLKKTGRGDDLKAHGWITLSGPNGTGKTHLLAAIVNHYTASDRPAIYITVQELLQELRETYDPHSEMPYSKLWSDIMRAEVLALDEIEKFSGTPWAQEQVFALLGRRHDERDTRLTILATNSDCRGGSFRLLPKGSWPSGYLESRISDGRNLLIADFWRAHDVRPHLEVIELARDEEIG